MKDIITHILNSLSKRSCSVWLVPVCIFVSLEEMQKLWMDLHPFIFVSQIFFSDKANFKYNSTRKNKLGQT